MVISDIALSAGGTSLDTAEREIEAIDAARSHAPALILSDVMLADGTGPRACAAIREEHGPIPVIFITGTPEACEPCEYAHAILAKPVLEGAIREAMREAMLEISGR